MKTTLIEQFIAKVENSTDKLFTLQYEDIHFMDMPKDKLLDYLNQCLDNSLCEDLTRKMKMFGVTAKELSEEIGISTPEFSMVISGKRMSWKHIKSRREFCSICDTHIKSLC